MPGDADAADGHDDDDMMMTTMMTILTLMVAVVMLLVTEFDDSAYDNGEAVACNDDENQDDAGSDATPVTAMR